MIEHSFDHNIWRIDFGLIGETLFNLMMTLDASRFESTTSRLETISEPPRQQTNRHASLVFEYNQKTKVPIFILLFPTARLLWFHRAVTI